MIRSLAAVLAVAGLALLVRPADAGKYNKKLKIGDVAPTWSGLPGVDGREHSLADLKDKDVVVLVITCNHCPVAQAYEGRIVSFAKKFAGGPDSKAALVAINVNNLEADKLPRMKERAKQKGFTFAYLYDASQQVGRAYGASVTPEFFVLNKDRKVVYMGSMDNDQGNPTIDYLSPAVEAALGGQAPKVAETRAFGCSVKYERR